MEELRPKSHPSWRRDLAALVIFIILSVVMTYPLILRMSDTITNWADPLLNAWIMAWDVHQVLNNPLHLYDANIFYPYVNTLAYSENLLASTLMVFPVILTTGNPVLAYNVLVLLSFVLSGFTAYLLGKELTGQRLPGMVGGVIYAFASYRFGEFGHVQLLTAQWIPLVLLYLARFLNNSSWRSGLAFALFFCLQSLSSFYYAFYIAIAVGLYLFLMTFLWLRHYVKTPSKLFPKAALLIILIALVIVPQAVPYFTVERELGMHRTLADTYLGSASLENYLAVPANSLYAQTSIPFVSKTPTEETLFPGLTVLALALVGILGWRRRKVIIGFYTALVVVSFLLSLGPNLRLSVAGQPLPWFPLPYGFLHEYLPGFQSMRVPARLDILVILGFSALASLGANRVLMSAGGRRQIILAPVIILLILAESLALPLRTKAIEVSGEVPQVYRWLADQHDGGVIFEYPTIESSFKLTDDEMERLGRYQYFSTYHWHPSVTGYSGFFPPLFWSIQQEAANFPSTSSVSLLRGLNIKYVIVHSDAMSSGAWGEMQRRFLAFPSELRQVTSFGSDVVYELTPGQHQGSLQIEAFLPSASNEGRYQAFVEVLNPDDAAVAYQLPKKENVNVRWINTSGQIESQELPLELPLFFPKGLTVLPLNLPMPSSGTYQLSLQSNDPNFAFGGQESVNLLRNSMSVTIAGFSSNVESLQILELYTERKGYRPGEILPVHIRWRAPDALSRDYTVSVKLIDTDNRAVAAIDSEPLQGKFSTRRWVPGSEVDDLYALHLPQDLVPGQYRLLVTAYTLPDINQAQLLDDKGTPVDTFIAGSVRVTREDGNLFPMVQPELKSIGGVLGGIVALRGMDNYSQNVKPGSLMRLKLYWEALQPLDSDFTGFVHLVDGQGKTVAQVDGPPGGNRFPTSIWDPGELMPDERDIKIPANLPPGSYTLKAGMYLLPGPQSLLVQNGGKNDDQNRLFLGELQIAP